MGIKSNDPASAFFNFFGATGKEAAYPLGPLETTGGTKTTNDDGDTVHVFTTPGPFTVDAGAGTVTILAVGGGGGGGGNIGGGAGAGAMVYLTGYPLVPGPYGTVTIGDGGAGATVPAVGVDGGTTTIPGIPTPVLSAGGGEGGLVNTPGCAGDAGGYPSPYPGSLTASSPASLSLIHI